MPRPLKADLTGRKIGRLTVLYRLPYDPSRRAVDWVCKCECGRRVVLSGGGLHRNTQSCGCLQQELRKAGRPTHGMRRSPIYAVWNGMINRCHNPNQPHYERYGGRGIYVCDEWRGSFAAFYRDMGDRPTGPTGKPYTIERVDNDGPYCKENCKWIPHTLQTRNKRPRRKRVA